MSDSTAQLDAIEVDLDTLETRMDQAIAEIERDIRRARILRRVQIGLFVASIACAIVQGWAEATIKAEQSA